jgi:hypothetical protein
MDDTSTARFCGAIIDQERGKPVASGARRRPACSVVYDGDGRLGASLDRAEHRIYLHVDAGDVEKTGLASFVVIAEHLRGVFQATGVPLTTIWIDLNLHVTDSF